MSEPRSREDASGGGPAVKICGVCDPRDAEEAVAAGASYIGVIRVPEAGRFRPLEVAREVCRAAAGARRVGVYVDAPADRILEEAERLGLEVVQLHGRERPEQVHALRERGLEVWKVVKPSDAADLEAAVRRHAGADLLLLEGRSDRGAGGVGARFDWVAVAAAVPRLPRETRLGVGGGLTPENVAEAVRIFRPVVVDVSSGVERTRGRKDAARVRSFIAAVRTAAGPVRPGPGGHEGTRGTHGGRGPEGGRGDESRTSSGA